MQPAGRAALPACRAHAHANAQVHLICSLTLDPAWGAVHCASTAGGRLHRLGLPVGGFPVGRGGRMESRRGQRTAGSGRICRGCIGRRQLQHGGLACCNARRAPRGRCGPSTNLHADWRGSVRRVGVPACRKVVVVHPVSGTERDDAQRGFGQSQRARLRADRARKGKGGALQTRHAHPARPQHRSGSLRQPTSLLCKMHHPWDVRLGGPVVGVGMGVAGFAAPWGRRRGGEPEDGGEAGRSTHGWWLVDRQQLFPCRRWLFVL